MLDLEVVTMWYNEEDLAPFFLKHYLMFADSIFVVVDSDTDDSTREIIKKFQKKNSNITCEEFTFPDMMDDDLKVKKLNEVVGRKKEGWVLVVDADEFVVDPRTIVERENSLNKNLIYVDFFQAYRNVKDLDLDINASSIIDQRPYGTKEFLIEGVSSSLIYRKPILFSRRCGFVLEPGNHFVKKNASLSASSKFILGAHWMMADEKIAVKRRIKGRKLRQSQNNKKRGYTVQHWNVTEEEIRKECLAHLNDKKMMEAQS